jgi:hypothetical protein
MRKSVTVVLASLLFVGCSPKPTDRKTHSPPPTEDPSYTNNDGLPGSEVIVAAAVAEASLIFIGRALGHPGTGGSIETGVNHHDGNFAVQDVLLGKTNHKTIVVQYVVLPLGGTSERAPRKHENVIIFLGIRTGIGNTKMLLANDRNKKDVMETIKVFKEKQLGANKELKATR